PGPASPARAAVGAVAAELSGVGLDDVLEAAALQTRVDRKYLVPVQDFRRLGAELTGFQVLQIAGLRSFRYESVYFDTSSLALYRQHLQGRRRRYKVRTRTYVESGETMFEVKLKGHRGRTVKERMSHPVEERYQITPTARAFLDRLLAQEYGERAPDLAPSVTTTYSRTTFVDLAGGARLTCDVDLVCRAGAIRGTPGDHVLVESKADGAGGRADAVLRRLGVRPVSVSKYCVGVALLHPGVPVNPWHRTLRRHFDYDATSTAVAG
ncbi:MAG: polyphosphate polymerase domain-containing protein, partial [Actinomycetota bacterium]|nr:polyphosphate polymerase domain-containing protein [Actinomycetota bacterium]